MKNITLLLLVLLTAVGGAKADTGKCVIDLTQFSSSGSETTYDPATLEMQTTAGWSGGIQWWPSYRWVATKFVVKTTNLAKLKIEVIYDDDTSTRSLPGTEATTFEVATNPNRIIKAFKIQDQQPSTVTFEKAYLESPGAIALTYFAQKEAASTWNASTGLLEVAEGKAWHDAIQYWPGDGSTLSGSKLVIYSEENADFKATVSYVGGGDANNGNTDKHSLTLDPSKNIAGITYQGVNTGTYHITDICLIPQTVFLDEYNSPTLSGVSGVNVVMNREMKKGWNSLCLPFATTAEALGKCKAYEFKSATQSSVTFSEVTELTAGTPYLVKFDAAVSNLTFENVDITETPAGNVKKGEPGEEVTFQGTYARIDDGKDKYGVMTDGYIKKGIQGAYFDGYRAYFTGLTVPPEGKSRVLLLDDDVTGISNVSVKTDNNNDMYTLSGMKVNGRPQKGIYIQNGKKYIVK